MDKNDFSGVYNAIPERDQLDSDINENLVLSSIQNKVERKKMTDNYDIIKDFLVPTDIVVEELGTNRSKITLEPFEQGFGHTLGNALRIMLSSMPGTAVSEVRIEGILHEYSTLEGVQKICN